MRAQNQLNSIASFTAPIKGWNVVDALPAMDPLYASVLDNVFCLPSELQIRKGYTGWSAIFGSCSSLFTYNKPDGSQKLFSVCQDSTTTYFFDSTNIGSFDVVLSVFNYSALVKTVNITTAGGSFCWIVNGSQDGYIYDGATFNQVTTISAPYAVTGVDSSTFSDVILFKRRVWFVQKNTLSVWYLATDAIAGAATEFDFSTIFTRGGYIVKIDSWSLDAGVGLDDHFIVATSQGEVAVYKGTDPASATTWQLVGVFYVGPPVPLGKTIKYGGDLLMLNLDGLVEMSSALMSSRVTTKSKITEKIQSALADAITNNFNDNRWDVSLFPNINALLINVPVTQQSTHQYVMNTDTGAWSRWTGIKANCWIFANNSLFFGRENGIYKAWDSYADFGSNITADIIPAYQKFGNSSRLKRFTLARAVLASETRINYGIRIETDFKLPNYPISIPFNPSDNQAYYDESRYDESVYSGELSISAEWQGVQALGFWASPHTQITRRVGDIRLYSYDLVIESGGNI